MFTPSMPSILIPGLAFAYFTADMKYVRSISLPTNEAVSKHFYTPQVKDIQRRFQEVSSFDASIAQDWLKNLEMHCMRVLVRAAEWEQWETNGGLMRLYHDMKQGREKLIDGSTASEQSHQRQQPTLSGESMPNPQLKRLLSVVVLQIAHLFCQYRTVCHSAWFEFFVFDKCTIIDACLTSCQWRKPHSTRAKIIRRSSGS